MLWDLTQQIPGYGTTVLFFKLWLLWTSYIRNTLLLGLPCSSSFFQHSRYLTSRQPCSPTKDVKPKTLWNDADVTRLSKPWLFQCGSRKRQAINMPLGSLLSFQEGGYLPLQIVSSFLGGKTTAIYALWHNRFNIQHSGLEQSNCLLRYSCFSHMLSGCIYEMQKCHLKLFLKKDSI